VASSYLSRTLVKGPVLRDYKTQALLSQQK